MRNMFMQEMWPIRPAAPVEDASQGRGPDAQQRVTRTGGQSRQLRSPWWSPV